MITEGDSVTHNTIVLGRADRLCAPDKKVDERRGDPYGPAPEDMIPQFITNWLGSYIDADSAPEMLMSPGVVP